MKKDLDLVEQKLHSYTKVITFEELVAEVATMTPLVEYAKLCKQLDENIKSQNRFAERKDTYEKLEGQRKLLQESIDTKLNESEYKTKTAAY